MATPLSDKIRALINQANLTTEASDATLEAAVRTLCEGYNGGKNIPSSPLVLRGGLSSRLAAILAYANETTGNGDTTMSDAIKALCDGYGGEDEIIFYDKLLTDGVACVLTDYVPNSVSTQSIYFKGVMPSYVTGAIWYGSVAGSSSTAPAFQLYQSSSTNSSYRRYSYFAFGSGTRASHAFASGTIITDIDATITKISSTSVHFDVKTGSLSASVDKTITEMSSSAFPNMVVLGKNDRGISQTCNLPNGSYVRKFEIVDSVRGTLTYLPCTCNGESGLYEINEGKFFGCPNGESLIAIND